MLMEHKPQNELNHKVGGGREDEGWINQGKTDKNRELQRRCRRRKEGRNVWFGIRRAEVRRGSRI